MKLEVDQSNRLEFSGPTFIALANDSEVVGKITHRVIHQALDVLSALRYTNQQKLPLLWATCVFILLRHYCDEKTLRIQPFDILLDNEYDGHQNLIKSRLIRFCEKFKLKNCRYQIISVGKHSPAHVLALAAYRKKYKTKPIVTIGIKELLEVWQ